MTKQDVIITNCFPFLRFLYSCCLTGDYWGSNMGWLDRPISEARNMYQSFAWYHPYIFCHLLRLSGKRYPSVKALSEQEAEQLV